MSRTTTDALSIIDHLLIGDDHDLRRDVDRASDRMRIGQLAYKAREQAGLTHAHLAKILHVPEADILDLEEADFNGDAFEMLTMIAGAVGKKVEFELVNT
jgi:hypothetical protein